MGRNCYLSTPEMRIISTTGDGVMRCNIRFLEIVWQDPNEFPPFLLSSGFCSVYFGLFCYNLKVTISLCNVIPL